MGHFSGCHYSDHCQQTPQPTRQAKLWEAPCATGSFFPSRWWVFLIISPFSMAEILVEVRPLAAAGDLTGQPAIPEAFMSRVEDLGQSLKEIAERLSQQLEDFEKKRAGTWQLER